MEDLWHIQQEREEVYMASLQYAACSLSGGIMRQVVKSFNRSKKDKCFLSTKEEAKKPRAEYAAASKYRCMR